MLGAASVQMCLDRFRCAEEEKRCHLCSILWKLSGDENMNVAIGAAGGCSIMCRCAESSTLAIHVRCDHTHGRKPVQVTAQLGCLYFLGL